MYLLGIPAARFDATLIADLDNFAAAAVAAAEVGNGRIEPSHVLIALARIPGSLASSLFATSQIPVDVFVGALRRDAGPGPTVLVTTFTQDTVSDATRTVFADLAALPDSATLGEREVIVAVLSHLEPVAKILLTDYGGADLGQWIVEAAEPPRAQAAVIAADGTVILDAFTLSAQQVLSTLVSEASKLGHRELGTLLLLHAMAVAPNGLLAQASRFLRQDLQDLRTHLLLLLRGRVHRPVLDVTLEGDAIRLLRPTLEKAATHAAGRGSDAVAEQDLLSALLDLPVGPIDDVLRGCAVDIGGLRHYTTRLYTEPPDPVPPPEPVPPSELDSFEKSLDCLRDNLIGQDQVIARLLPRLDLIKRAARRGFRMGERPLATFLFCGPSGTGKTMTGRLIAQAIYGSADDLIFFDMGQFNSRHAGNVFIGAPHGYIGFGQGKLTNGLRDKPRSVLLFDEVEKADPLVLDALLGLLDEGRVNDPAGPVRDARDAIVVLTSNLGAREFADLGRRRIGQDDEPEIAARMRAVLEGPLRPEFLNRIDEMILFAPLGVPELEAIASAELRKLAATLRGSVELSWDNEVPPQLVRTATRWRADEAARGVKRCVDEVLQLVLRALDDAEERGEPLTAVRVVVRDGKLAVVNADA